MAHGAPPKSGSFGETYSRVAVAYDCFFPLTTGGGERLYVGFARELAHRGCSVDYLTSAHRDERPPSDFSVVEVSPALRLYDEDGVRRTSAALRFAWGLLRALRQRRDRYDLIIVSALPVLNVFAARLALMGSGTVVICDYLEVWGRRQWIDYAGGVTGRLGWLLQRAAIFLTPLATCHSELSAMHLRREGLRGEPVVSPGLIDTADAPAERSSARQPPYVLYAGRHIQDKRVEALPGAVAAARREIPGLQLRILGEGQSTPRVREAVAEVSGEEWVTLEGFVSQEALDAAIAGATCLANPSRREGYGLVVVEAAAHGTPSVLVADPGNASVELVVPGVNGFVAESVAPSDVGEAIVQVVRGGGQLRASTRVWFDDAIRSKTIVKTIDGVLAAVQGAHDGVKK